MNTQEELEIAFEEYQNGTFIKRGISYFLDKARICIEEGCSAFRMQDTVQPGVDCLRMSL